MFYKINKPGLFILMFLISMVLMGPMAPAQSNVGNKYGLFVTDNIKLLQSEISSDTNMQMIDVKKAIPAIITDLKYATPDNFMHRKLYPNIHSTYLRLPAIIGLKKVVEELKSKNLSLKIFDAYRPYSVTEEMWEAVKDSRYAADPSKGSGRNRGIAVDLTLIDLHTHKELLMGTGFDNFSDTAHTDFTSLPDSVLQNRRLLQNVMAKYGFISLDTEWWHFSLPNSSAYQLLNVSFDALKKLNAKKKH